MDMSLFEFLYILEKSTEGRKEYTSWVSFGLGRQNSSGPKTSVFTGCLFAMREELACHLLHVSFSILSLDTPFVHCIYSSLIIILSLSMRDHRAECLGIFQSGHGRSDIGDDKAKELTD